MGVLSPSLQRTPSVPECSRDHGIDQRERTLVPAHAHSGLSPVDFSGQLFEHASARRGGGDRIRVSAAISDTVVRFRADEPLELDPQAENARRRGT